MIFLMIMLVTLILSVIAIFVLMGVSLYFSIKEHKRILKEIDDENDF